MCLADLETRKIQLCFWIAKSRDFRFSSHSYRKIEYFERFRGYDFFGVRKFIVEQLNFEIQREICLLRKSLINTFYDDTYTLNK